MDHHVGRQLLQRDQVVLQGLLDQVALLHAARARVAFERLPGCRGDERRDLDFLVHFLDSSQNSTFL